MKKLSILISSILLLLVGCTAELENGNPIVDGETLTVSFEPVTRAQFDTNLQTVWNSGDFVSVFHKQDVVEKWTYTGSEGAPSGPIKRGDIIYGNEIDKSIIVYPHSEDYTINPSANTVSTVFPSTQHYQQKSFGKGGNIMVAVSENTNFTMKSVVGWLKLQLIGDKTVGKIMLNGNDPEKDILAGPMDINYETQAISFVSGDNSGGSEMGGTMIDDLCITLDCGNGVSLNPTTPTDFYIALPPHTFASGLTIAVKDTEGKLMMTKSTTREVKIERRHILPLKEFTVEIDPAIALPAITNVTATQLINNGLSVTVTFPRSSSLATLECHLYQDGQDKAPLTRTVSATELSNGSCSFDIGSGLAAGTCSLEITPLNSTGGRGTTKTTDFTIKNSLSVAQVDNLIKILPKAAVTHKPEVLRVARGETATLQLAITALENVGQVIPSVSFKGTASLPATLGWLRNVKSTECWPDYGSGINMTPSDQLLSDGDMYPDPIMPVDAWPVSLGSGQREVLWTEFSVDRNCTPGTYEGTVLLSVNGGAQTIAAPFTIEVYSATLPEKQTFTLVQWETGTYAAMNGGTEVTVGSDRYFELQKNMVQLVSKYGQNGFRLHDGLIPSKLTSWYSDVNKEKDPTTGKPILSFDFWSAFDKYIDNYLKNCPYVSQIHGPGFASLQSDPTKADYGRLKAGISYYDPSREWPVAGKGAVPEDPDAQHFIKYYFQKLEAYLKGKQLNDGTGRTYFDIYYQSIFDEPNDARAADWNAWAALIKAGSPTMKIVEATNTNQLNPDYCDILCPVLDNLSNTQATGNQTQWFYTAVFPMQNYANRFVRLPLIKTRLLHWIHYKYNSVGTLHWGLMYWMGLEHGDPYGDVQGMGLPGGDLFITYPGYGVAYPSIRLAAMRDGVNDYELLKLLEKKSSADAQALANNLIEDYDSYNTGVENFRAVRKQLLEKLSQQ